MDNSDWVFCGEMIDNSVKEISYITANLSDWADGKVGFIHSRRNISISKGVENKI